MLSSLMLGIHTKPSLYRDFALLSALIVFILFLVSVWVSYETYQEHSKDIIKQLENETVRIDRSLIVEVERASYLLESIARQINHTGTTNHSMILQLFNSFDKSSYPRNSEFFWVNTDQMIVLSSRKGVLKKPIEVSDRDYLKKAITTPWTVHIGQPVEGRASNRWVMPMAIGLSNEQGDFLGALVISLDINSFSKDINHVIQHEGISFAITNEAFTLLTEISEHPHFFQKFFNLQTLAKIDFKTHPKGVYSQTNLMKPGTIYAFYEKSLEYPYIIFVGYDSTLSAHAIRGILLPRLLQIIVITAFLVSILWTVRKRIIQPVITLTKLTSRIIHGEKFSPVMAKGPIEIENLAAEISRIGSYIDERRRIERELSSKNIELLKIRESAEMTNEIKAQFFEQVGNALMQPATAIIEYAESLRNELFGALGNAKYNEISEKMFWQATTIIDLLNDILAISRAESGLLALNESAVEVPLVIKKCIRILVERSKFQSVEILQDYDDNLPLIRADELRIKQLFLNLLSGAASQVAAGDAIRIRSQMRREGLMIKLEYNLSNTPSDAQNSRNTGLNLNKFSGIATKRAIGAHSETSLGLGFALNQLIVSMHEGTLDVKTNADRKVTVTVTLPEKRVIGAS